MSRPLNPSQRHRQAQLAGAGNIIAWIDPNAGKSAAALRGDASAVVSASATEASASTSERAVAAEHATDGAVSRPWSSGERITSTNETSRDGAPAPAAPVRAPINNGDVRAGDDAPRPAPVVLEIPFHDRPVADKPGSLSAPDAATLSSHASTHTFAADIMGQHAIFLRVLTSRLTETRNIGHMWSHAPSHVAETNATAAEDARARTSARVHSLDGLFASLTFLHTSAHESVAVDVIHACASANTRIRVLRSDLRKLCERDGAHIQTLLGEEEEEEGDEPVTVWVQLCGGFPTWAWPDVCLCSWVHTLSSVLEGILLSRYEDYITVGLQAVGSMLEALAPLFTLASRCTAADLATPTVLLDDDAGGDAQDMSAEDDDGDSSSKIDADVSSDMSARERAARRHVAARQAVYASKAMFPLIAAMSHASSYGGRVARATQPRLARLTAMQDTVRHLVTADTLSHAELPERGPLRPSLPAARYRGSASDGKFDP